MTVGKIIELLRQFDPGTEVKVSHCGVFYPARVKVAQDDAKGWDWNIKKGDIVIDIDMSRAKS